MFRHNQQAIEQAVAERDARVRQDERDRIANTLLELTAKAAPEGEAHRVEAFINIAKHIRMGNFS